MAEPVVISRVTCRPVNTVWSEGIAQRAFRSVDPDVDVEDPAFPGFFGSCVLPVGVTSVTPVHSKGAGPFLM